jgi:predicted butyrate kinase (DUF1464 family)
MGMQAGRLEAEPPVEERTIRLEERFEAMQADIAEIKGDVRRIDGRVDAVATSVAGLRVEMKEGFAELRAEMKEGFAAADSRAAAFQLQVAKEFAAVRLEAAESSAKVADAIAGLRIARVWDRVWWLAITGATLALVARAFKWI